METGPSVCRRLMTPNLPVTTMCSCEAASFIFAISRYIAALQRAGRVDLGDLHARTLASEARRRALENLRFLAVRCALCIAS
jgi:hypothetical protein